MTDTPTIMGVLPLYLGVHSDDYDDEGSLIIYDAIAAEDGSYQADDEWLQGVDDDIAGLEDDCDSLEIAGDSIEGRKTKLQKAKALLRRLETRRQNTPKSKKRLRKRLANRIRRVKARIRRLDGGASSRRRQRGAAREGGDSAPEVRSSGGTGNDVDSIVAARLGIENLVLLPMKVADGSTRGYAFEVGGSNLQDAASWVCDTPNYADFIVHGYVIQAVAHSKLVTSNASAAPIAALVSLDQLGVSGDSDVIYGSNQVMLRPDGMFSASGLLVTTFLRKRPSLTRNSQATATTTLRQYLPVNTDQGESISGIVAVSLIVEVIADEAAGLVSR